VTLPENFFTQLKSVRIAADARLAQTNFADDQIWELSLSGGKPDALSVSTSYGLRARETRIFPAVSLDGTLRTSPSEFFTPPEFQAVYPNYAALSFSPFQFTRVDAEFKAADSRMLAGRWRITNKGEEPQSLQLILFVLHLPGSQGFAFNNHLVEGVHVLAGGAGSIQPVIFLSGGSVPAQAVYPGLTVSADLQPGEERTWTWIHAGHERTRESFQACRSAMKENWDARTAHLELTNAGFLQIQTGDPAWDLAFHLSQKTALASIMSPTYALPHASYVDGRTPDRGYSMEGRGRDYDNRWSGQTVQETAFLVSQLKYSAPDLAQGLALNFLHRQQIDGFASSKPGLAGQRDANRCPPLLATMIWQLYQHTGDRTLLAATRNGLYSLFQSWFSETQDRDGDGFPEWDNVLHAEYEHWLPFVRWHAWSQGMEVAKAETIDLLSFLLRELTSLQLILEELNDHDRHPLLEIRKAALLELLDSCWLHEKGIFSHRDRDSHTMLAAQYIGRGSGSFTRKPGRTFDQPVRVLARMRGDENLSRSASIAIHGRGQRGRSRVETLTTADISWFGEFGTVTSDKTYRHIEKIEMRGLSRAFTTELLVPGTRSMDSAVLLPLWAGSLDPERAGVLVRNVMLQPKHFWRPYGIPQCAVSQPLPEGQTGGGCRVVSMVRNAQLGEGLLRYGYRQEAADLVIRLMTAVTRTIASEQGFRALYDAETGAGSGTLDSVAGLAPLELFLKTAGIHLTSPSDFIIEGRCPYPWPVVIRWKGLCIRRDQESTEIVFPDGTELSFEGEETRHVSLERNDIHGLS